MRAGNIPTARFAPILERLILERWPDGDGIQFLADNVGCDYKTITNILERKYVGCDFNLADKLLCSLNRVEMWHGELADVYEAVELSDTHACKHGIKVPLSERIVDACDRCRRSQDTRNARKRRVAA